MAYQDKFWRGQIKTHKGREDTIRGNPEAPPMHEGPGDFDKDMPKGADAPPEGSSQPKVKGNSKGDEFPLRHAHVKPRRHGQLHQVLMAHVLRKGGESDDGTTMGTAVGGGAAGGGAGS
jgi:hypothetical protein